jgi:hypothetical protein
MLAAFLELPARVPAPTGWWNLLLIPIGLLFSYVESSVRLNLFGGPAQLLALICFSGNTTQNDNGGGMAITGSLTTTLVNVTFSGNATQNGKGGGMCNNSSSPTLTNVIIWGNTAPNGLGIFNTGSVSPTISYSNVQGCGGSSAWVSARDVNGGSNIAADPLFIDANGTDNITGTLDDNLRLQTGSPLIDVGNNTAVPCSVTTDLDGNLRIFNSVVDMGAYEWLPIRVYLPLVVR